MFGGVGRLGISCLRSGLLSPRDGRRSGRGVVLVEWLVGQTMGLVVAAAATWAFLHHLQIVAAAFDRQLREEDQRTLSHYMGMELRMAGHRFVPGPSVEHDRLQLEGDPDSPSLRYLCDRSGATDPRRAAAWRVQSHALAFRHPGSSAYQALHDSRLSGLRGWRLEQRETPDCTPDLRIELLPSDPNLKATLMVVRPRNLGLLPCEAAANAMGNDAAR